MKATIAALLICLGSNAFAQCVASAAQTCLNTAPASNIAHDAALLKTASLGADVASPRAAPTIARPEVAALRGDTHRAVMRSTLTDVAPLAQARQDSAAALDHPVGRWGDSGLLLVGVALMIGIALRRAAAHSR